MGIFVATLSQLGLRDTIQPSTATTSDDFGSIPQVIKGSQSIVIYYLIFLLMLT
jgi:hypothetical protein